MLLATKKKSVDDFRALCHSDQTLEYIMENIDPHVKVKTLPIAQRQMIEIAKALLYNASIIAFDEPTSSLSQKEYHQPFRTIRAQEQGKTVIYVSHRLEEVFELCDSVTVFRDGFVEKFTDMEKLTQDVWSIGWLAVTSAISTTTAAPSARAPSSRWRTSSAISEIISFSSARRDLQFFGLSGPDGPS